MSYTVSGYAWRLFFFLYLFSCVRESSKCFFLTLPCVTAFFIQLTRRCRFLPPNEYLYPPPPVEEEDVFIPGLPRLVEDVVPAVVVPPLPSLGHGAGEVSPAQEPTPGTGCAARNATLVRVLRAIDRYRN